MKKIIGLVCLLSVSVLQLFGQEKIIDAPIEAVKIHLRGAEIIRSQTINLTAGKHKLILSGLSPKLSRQTIIATASNEVTILSITSRTNFLKKSKANATQATKIKILRDSLELLQLQQQDHRDILTALKSDENILKQNQQLLNSPSKFSAEEVIQLSKYYKEEIRNIITERTKQNRALKKIAETINRINQQLNELNARQKPTSEIYLDLITKKAISTEIMVRYIINEAGWSPIYDLKAGNLDQPIALKYRALAFNDSGVDWTDAKITLSTADPNKSASQPTLAPWRLNQNTSVQNSFAQRQGRLNRSNVMNQVQVQSFKKDAKGQNLDQVQIRFETIQVSELNKDFEIEEVYSIPSDRKPYSIDITSYDLKASYRHFAVPKMDKDAFLLAQITGWEELDLIPGPMNVYRGETYVGLSELNTQTLNDTLDLSLGRDKNVVVSRIKQKELTKKQFLGPNKRATYGYKISVKNNHTTPISIEIQDQVPTSTTKEIEVTLKELSNALHYKSTGKLVWEFSNLKPKETKSINFGFEIKYPKNMQVQLKKERAIMTPRYF